MALTEQQTEAALLLAMGSWSQDQILEAVGTSRMTLWRWRQDPEFAAEVDRYRAAVSQGAVSRIFAVVDVAVDCYVDIAKDKGQPAEQRLAAADRIIQIAGVGSGTAPTADEDDLEAAIARVTAMKRRLLAETPIDAVGETVPAVRER